MKWGLGFSDLGHIGLLGGAGVWRANFERLRVLAAAQTGVSTPHQNGAMASPPTVTTSTSFPVGVHASTAKLWTTTPTVFQYYGGRVETFATDYRRFPVATRSLGAVDRVVARVHAKSNSDAVAFRVLGYTEKYRIIVKTAAGFFYVDKAGVSTATTGGVNYIKLDFGGVKAAREYIIEGQLDFGFTGMYCTSGDVISIIDNPEPFRLICMTDSFGLTGTTFKADCFPLMTGELLGVWDIWDSAVGTTGWLADASGTRYNFGQRLADATAQAPNALFMCGGVNDLAFTQAQITAAVAADLSTVRAALPATPIFIVGPWDVNAPAAAAAGYAGVKAGLQAACAGRSGVWFIDMEGVEYTKSDAMHPDTAGHVTLAASINTKTRAILGIA